MYREQRDALAAELHRLAGDRVRLTVPDQGMHVLADLGADVSDVDLVRAAAADGRAAAADGRAAAAPEQGVVARAISPWYRKAPRRSALMLGFTGFTREEIVAAAARLARTIERAPRRSTR